MQRSPLVLGLDEFSSGNNFALPAIDSWLARFRKFGLVCICGVHNYSQLNDTYGKDKARKIIECFGNKIFFNPNGETAEDLMKELGDQEVLTRTISVGTKGQRNTSFQRDKAPLLTADQIRKMPSRSAVLISQAVEGKFKGQWESSVPWKIKKVTLPKVDLAIEDQSAQWWDEIGENRFIERAQSFYQWTPAKIELALKQREQIAEKLLPMPLKGDGEKQLKESLLDRVAKARKKVSVLKSAKSP